MKPNVFSPAWTALMLLVFPLASFSRSVAKPRAARNVCSVVEHATQYLGHRVVVRGMVLANTMESPTMVLGGNCSQGLILNDEKNAKMLDHSPGYRRLMAAIWKPTLTSYLYRHIWITAKGVLCAPSTNRLCLQLQGVSDVVVKPVLTVEKAELPHYPSSKAAIKASGEVHIYVVVRKGTVERAESLGGSQESLADLFQKEKHPLSMVDESFADAALKSISTWVFDGPINAEFTATFIYQIRLARRWPPPDNPQVRMNLPYTVVITHYVSR